MKTIDLSNIKSGDKVKCRDGSTMIFAYFSLGATHPFRFSNEVGFGDFGYNVWGQYQLVNQLSVYIVEILPKFDFSVLPNNCSGIIIDGVMYKKSIKWEADNK